ncbi:MAG: FxsA family protein [Paracoccaceae bacterium]|nr:FxsA family protein [Paracoccaceae bacterium]
MWLFLIFVAVPIIEIALFIQVGGVIGLWPTLAIVVLTAFAGTWLMRQQGMMTLAKLQKSLAEGGNPADPMAQGAMILVAGVLLLTPGFFTDTIGFMLLLPPVRAALIKWISARIVASGSVHFSSTTSASEHGASTTIETDYIIIDEDSEPREGPSGWTKH